MFPSYFLHTLPQVTIWSRNSFLLLCRIKEDDISKQGIFLICNQLMTELFYLSNLLQMPNVHRMVDNEFSSNFLCSCNGISFDGPLNWLLSSLDGQPPSPSTSRLPSLLQNFLTPHCTVCSLAIPGPNASLMLRAVSAALLSILDSNKKITQIYFLSNIISLV